jgi:hypothetical protein
MKAAPAGREEEILMSRKMLRVLAVLSLVTLSAATVHASGRSLSSPGESAFTSAWEWIARWFQPNGTKTDAGSQMDPNG